MKMDKKTTILIALCVLAVVVVAYQFRGMFSSGKPAPVAAKPAPAQKAPVASSKASGSALLAEKIRSLPANDYEAHIAKLKMADVAFHESGFKNPMSPAEGESLGTQSWIPVPVVVAPVVLPDVETLALNDSIEGIVWNDKDPLALVNNQVVGIGEELEDGAVVTEITRDTVRFKRNGKRYYLVLREE